MIYIKAITCMCMHVVIIKALRLLYTTIDEIARLTNRLTDVCMTELKQQ